ncbi:uncharacterized protein J3D65DRAFT_252732 [Phyllosticta citribraziliensis]|uniref:Uncharacterized protein n=1 Tax=Phyllosticta citribraziliensis TaxID=989973 RepID=A0ABR1M1A0_9PEZI
MVQFIPPPDPHALLPPLLACLPLAFASPRPPPALLPLLSPILRQRVQLLSGSSQNESWLPLLCWDREKAGNLTSIIANIELEPHPASGEIELGHVNQIRYRRRDEETLEARIELPDLQLLPVFLWCVADATGGGPGWRLTELRTTQDHDHKPEEWFPSMDEAREASKAAYIADALRSADVPAAPSSSINHHAQTTAQDEDDDDDDDDDDYWNMYDRTPNRTPAKESPAPQVQRPTHLQQQQTSHSNLAPSTEELEYFARYAAEVQPALDAHDPEEETPAGHGFESTLHGDTFSASGAGVQFEPAAANIGPRGYDSSLPPHTNGAGAEAEAATHGSQPQEPLSQTSPFETLTHSELNHPQPISSTSPGGGSGSPASAASSSSVARMEAAAAGQAAAEVAIKQHISTDLKSLYRLARSAGIARDEFERIVRTELEVLGMMGLDDDE